VQQLRGKFWIRPLAALLIAAFPLSSCSLFVRETNQPVVITTSDPNAQIFVDGVPVGVGTATTEMKRDEGHAILAKTPDNRASTGIVGTKISTTGVLDIIGGCIFLLPFLGMLSSGFYTLDTNHVAIAIPPAPTPAH